MFEEKRKTNKEVIMRYENIRNNLYIIILGVIVAGFLHYAAIQYNYYGSRFSLVKLFLHNNCKNL
jgi:hypothetical protein